MRSFVQATTRTLTRVLDWIAPLQCPACGANTVPESPACTRCLSRVSSTAESTHARGIPVLTAAPFEGPVADAIRGLKYHGRHEWARPLGHWTATRVRSLLPAPPAQSFLVPVPLHRRRLAERGYNQAALIGASLGRAFRIPVNALALTRRRDTAQQALLDREGRLDNVRDGFTARIRMEGCTVIVVDDVVTTGATALACVSALQAAGATVHGIVAVARARYGAPEAVGFAKNLEAREQTPQRVNSLA